jgi:hypothetical protein
MSRVQGHLGADATGKFRSVILNNESSGNYGNTGNPFGYIGGFQFGAQALQTVGLIKPGMETAFSKLGTDGHKSLLDNPNNWTTPGGKAAFLANPAAQDQAFDKLTELNYRRLTTLGVINANTSPGDVAGYLAAAHLIGADGVYNKGLGGVDRNGTAAKKYFQDAKSALGDKSGIPADAQTGRRPGNSTAGKTEGTSDGAPPPPPTRVDNNVTIGSYGSYFENIPVPISNPLGVFSSFNCVLTLSSISKESHRRPQQTYKAGNIGEVVLRSAGAGSKAQLTAMKTPNNPTGQYDFFIDNLEIQSLITFNQQTKGTNATDITFDVFEPYSMGVFLQSCQLAAEKNGWELGYLNSVFLLTIEFVGYDEVGDVFPLQRVTRHIPMIIKDVAMSTNSKGSVYKVRAHPSNELVLTDQYAKLQADASVSGKTVKEILQTGEFSLQNFINKKSKETAVNSKVPTAFDETVIIFPDSTADNAEAISGGFLGPLEGETTSGATLDPNNPNVGNNVSLYRPDSSANLIQPDATVNVIGKSVMDLNSSMPGEGEINKQNEVQTDAKQPANRKQIQDKSSTRQFMYKQGSSVVNAISSILLKSKYCIDALDKNKVDEKGMVDWFRIETQIDYYPPKPGNKGNNTDAKLIIYKVVPYKVHHSKIAPNGSKIKGYDRLRNEAAKVYDYIYTGKNTEILNLELDFPRAFFNSVTADNTQLNSTAVYGRQQSTGLPGAAPSQPDNTPNVTENTVPNLSTGYELKVQSNMGGSGAEDHRSAIANRFQRALYDSRTDLMNATMTIMGDPYFLADSGLGNFSNTGSGRYNVTADQAMDYQSGEVDVIINFRTPLDYGPDGIMNFGDSNIVQQFSGLYKVNMVQHKISRGKFTQELKLQRRPKQYVSEQDLFIEQTGSTQSEGNEGEAEAQRNVATANPQSADGKSGAIEVTTATSASPLMTEAEIAQLSYGDWMGP